MIEKRAAGVSGVEELAGWQSGSAGDYYNCAGPWV